MSKKDTVEVTQGFLEYQNAELGKLRERLHGMRAKLRQAEAEKVELQRSLELLRRDNERLSNALRIKDGKLRGKCADLNMARKDPCGTLRAMTNWEYYFGTPEAAMRMEVEFYAIPAMVIVKHEELAGNTATLRVVARFYSNADYLEWLKAEREEDA